MTTDARDEILALDFGGSGSRASRVVRAQSTETVAIEFGLPVGQERDGLAALVERLLSRFTVPPDPVAIAASVRGLLRLGDGREVLALLASRWPRASIAVVPDSLASLFGAFGREGGVVVNAGTGVAALGTNLHDEWYTADGWGYLLGDSGSAASIGQAGLVAALKARDGVLPGGSALLERLNQVWADPFELCRQLYLGREQNHLLAGFAPMVADAAASGDPVSARILGHAGQCLAETALACLRGTVPSQIAFIGGVMNAGPHLTDSVARRVRLSGAATRLIFASATALDGSRIIATQLRDTPASLRSQPPYLWVYGAQR